MSLCIYYILPISNKVITMLGQGGKIWEAEDIILLNAFSDIEIFLAEACINGGCSSWGKVVTYIEKPFPQKSNTLESKCLKKQTQNHFS